VLLTQAEKQRPHREWINVTPKLAVDAGGNMFSTGQRVFGHCPVAGGTQQHSWCLLSEAFAAALFRNTLRGTAQPGKQGNSTQFSSLPTDVFLDQW